MVKKNLRYRYLLFYLLDLLSENNHPMSKVMYLHQHHKIFSSFNCFLKLFILKNITIFKMNWYEYLIIYFYLFFFIIFFMMNWGCRFFPSLVVSSMIALTVYTFI